MSSSPSLRFAHEGEPVVFQDAEEVRRGICNGRPIQYSPNGPTYVPVHVPETNENIMVNGYNIIEWPDND